MSNKYKNNKDISEQFPFGTITKIVEKPDYKPYTTIEKEEYKRDLEAYESSQSIRIPLTFETGKEILELDKDFELLDTHKWYYAVCEKCDWKGSSEKLDGGGQIADTGDYGDAYCPKCGSKDIIEDDKIDSYAGTVAIPIEPVVPIQNKTNDMKELIDALNQIAYPIKYFQENLKEGEQLNGQMAVALSNDANYLQGIAKKALDNFMPDVVVPVVDVEQVDFGNIEEMAQDCWLFFKGNDHKKTITKDAFIHEVGAILTNVKEHFKNKL